MNWPVPHWRRGARYRFFAIMERNGSNSRRNAPPQRASFAHLSLTAWKYEVTVEEVEAASRFVFAGYDRINNLRLHSERIRAAAQFLNGIHNRRRSKLWRQIGMPYRRLKVNRSTKQFISGAIEHNQPPVQLIPETLWGQVKQLLPTKPIGRLINKGRVAIDDRTAFSGMLYVLTTTCTWERLPPEFGHWHQVQGRYKVWKRSEGFAPAVALCLQVYSDG